MSIHTTAHCISHAPNSAAVWPELRQGSKPMRRTVVQSTFVALTVIATIGCQSGPRWAWWKKDTPLSDSSAVARTAEPALPSSQSTPTAVTAAGIQPATPPSSANLAAAGTAASAPLTAATTAPTAGSSIYPTTGAPPIVATGTLPTSGASSVSMAGVTRATTPIPAATAPAGGPYNPNAYQPAAAMAATGPNPAAVGGADRYGTVPPSGTAPGAERYGAPAVASTNPVNSAGAPPVNTAATGIAPSGADRYGILPVAAPTTTAGATPTAAPGYGTTTSEVGTAYAPATGAQITTAPAGQYRPAGTSDYIGGPSGNHVEIATRPTTPAPAPASATPPATYPPSSYGGSQPY